MADILFYDPTSVVVPNRVTAYMGSVNTPDYDSIPNKIVTPDLSGVGRVPQEYWKVVADTVTQMTSDEKVAVDNFLKAKTLRNKNFKISTYDTMNRCTSDAWYDIDNGDGTYTGLSEQITYVYQSSTSVLLSETNTVFYYDGTQQSSTLTTYFKNDQNQIIVKTSMQGV